MAVSSCLSPPRCVPVTGRALALRCRVHPGVCLLGQRAAGVEEDSGVGAGLAGTAVLQSSSCCLSGAVPGPGEARAPTLLGLHPRARALLAAAAGALAARPIWSLCVQRTETKQNKLVSWPEQRAHTVKGGLRGAAPCLSPPSQGLWLSAATSCRLLFYIWYFEKSMMVVNGVQRRGRGPGLPTGRRSSRPSPAWPGAAVGAAGAASSGNDYPICLSDRRGPWCPPSRASASTAGPRLEGAAELIFQELRQARQMLPSPEQHVCLGCSGARGHRFLPP